MFPFKLNSTDLVFVQASLIVIDQSYLGFGFTLSMVRLYSFSK